MQLPTDEIHLHYVRTDEVSDPVLLKHYQAMLSEQERHQMSRFYYQAHRHQFLLTRALLRCGLSQYHDLDPADWYFDRNGYDKPFVSQAALEDPVRFNISHAQGLVICGFSASHEVGVDVEDAQRSTGAAFQHLARYFSQHEIDALTQLPEKQQRQRFFDLWTLKESYIKARGMGLSIPLNHFGFKFKHGELNGFYIDEALSDKASDWQFWQLTMHPNYRLAVAIKSCLPSLKIKLFNSIPTVSLEAGATDTLFHFHDQQHL